MNFFKKLGILGNRDYALKAELENHPFSNQNIYRLYQLS